jgi:hypothetical protein
MKILAQCLSFALAIWPLWAIPGGIWLVINLVQAAAGRGTLYKVWQRLKNKEQ